MAASPSTRSRRRLVVLILWLHAFFNDSPKYSIERKCMTTDVYMEFDLPLRGREKTNLPHFILTYAAAANKGGGGAGIVLSCMCKVL